MNELFDRAMRRFLDSRNWWPFVLGAVCLGIMGNAAFTFLQQSFAPGAGRPEAVMIFFIGFGALILFAFVGFAFQKVYAGFSTLTSPRKAPPKPRRGLILMIGNGGAKTGLEAIHHHAASLQHIWLIHSDETEPIARQLQDDEKKPGRVFELRRVADVYDVTEIFTIVSAIYNTRPCGWTVDDLIADFTGMTANASVGMVLACLKMQAPMEYTAADRDADLNPVGALRPFEVTFPDEIPKKG